MRQQHRGLHDRGAAAVEFAIVSVLLLTLVFGIIQYGYYFFQATAAEHAAREGARLAAVGVNVCDDWGEIVVDRGGAANVQRAEATLTDQRGDPIKVTVTWQRQGFGFPFVPFLGEGAQTEAAQTRAERIGTEDSGCNYVAP